MPFAGPGSAERQAQAAAMDPSGRVCPACGTSAPPDDTFCTNCGRPLPLEDARPSRRGWSTGTAGDGPAWRRLPIWMYGAAIAAVVVIAAGVLLLSRPSGTLPVTRSTGTPYTGDGYSLVLPSSYDWVHIQVAGGDQWHVQLVGSPGKAIEVTLVDDLATAEQTLEGALGRMESGIPTIRRPVSGPPQAVSLPAGRAYRVADSGGYDTFVFFKDGRAIFVAFHNLSLAEEDAVATSVMLK